MTLVTVGFIQTFSNKTSSHAVLLACFTSIATLTGCQSTPLPPHTLNSPALTPSQTAHNLMTDTMLHRFDKAYDFEKTTKYQAFALYADNDIEKKDQSLWLTLLKNYVNRKKSTHETDSVSERALSEEEQHCEDAFDTAQSKILDDYIDHKISDKTLDKKSKKIKTDHDKCLDNLPADIKSERNASEAVASNNKNISQDKQSKTSTSEASQNTLSTSKYQLMAQAMIDKLNVMDKDTATSAPSKHQQDDKEIAESDDDILMMLKNLKLTPQQIQVLNDSYLAPHVFSYKGSYNPTNNQFSTVYEESLNRPFVDTYRRVPVLVDFKEMSITAEPDIALPFIGVFSLLSDNKQTLDKNSLGNLAGKSVKLTLPDKLKQKIPLNLLKDTLITAIGKSYADLPAERFSDITLDDYAKSLNASRAVKLNLTHQDIGYLFGRSMKYWANQLNTLTAQHPEYLTNPEDFKVSLDLLNALNRHYRAEDVAKIAQIIEAILPLSYNGYNYYYFDSQNKLIGYRKNTDYSTSLFGARVTSTTLSKITYRRDNNGTDNTHTFYHPNPEEVLDGNALWHEYKTDNKLQKEAQEARWGYDSVTKHTPPHKMLPKLPNEQQQK